MPPRFHLAEDALHQCTTILCVLCRACPFTLQALLFPLGFRVGIIGTASSSQEAAAPRKGQ